MRPALFVLTLVALGCLLSPRTARAQAPAADSLAGLLSTPDIHMRAVAVARLNALPISELTPGARTALVSLLDAEARGQVPDDPNVVPDEDETYDEYIVDLTDAVLKLHDPAAIRGLTLLGIQTGMDVQQYIASRGRGSLVALDEAWGANPNDRPAIIETWGLMLGANGAAVLDASSKGRVLASIIAAADSFPIAVAAAAREASLVALLPALDEIAGTTTSEVVKSRAEKAVEELGAARGALSAEAILEMTSSLVDGFCESKASLAAAPGQPNRPSTCGKLGADLNRAVAAVKTGRPAAARLALGRAAATATVGRDAGALTAAEAATVLGNVQYLLTRI